MSVATAAAAEAGDAQPLDWSAPEGCPQRAAVLDSLASLMRVEPESWSRFDRVRGHVRQNAGAWTLELEFVSGARVGRRGYTTRECSDLAHAAAVALALVLDPAWDWSAEPASEPAASLDAPNAAKGDSDERAPDQTAAATDARAAGTTTPIELSVGIEALLDATTFSNAAFGVGLTAQARADVFSVALYGNWLPKSSLELEPSGQLDSSLLTGGVRGCYWFSTGLAACSDFEAGSLAVKASGLQINNRSTDLWLAPGLSVALSSRVLRALDGMVRISLLLPLIRPNYRVRQNEETVEVFEIPSVTVRVALGAAVSLF